MSLKKRQQRTLFEKNFFVISLIEVTEMTCLTLGANLLILNKIKIDLLLNSVGVLAVLGAVVL
jgi:hypothetical protein